MYSVYSFSCLITGFTFSLVILKYTSPVLPSTIMFIYLCCPSDISDAKSHLFIKWIPIIWRGKFTFQHDTNLLWFGLDPPVLSIYPIHSNCIPVLPHYFTILHLLCDFFPYPFAVLSRMPLTLSRYTFSFFWNATLCLQHSQSFLGRTILSFLPLTEFISIVELISYTLVLFISIYLCLYLIIGIFSIFSFSQDSP